MTLEEKEYWEKEYWQKEKWIREKQKFCEEDRNRPMLNPIEVFENPFPIVYETLKKEWDKV